MRWSTRSAIALITVINMLITVSIVRSQGLSSARGIALGAYTAFTRDVHSLDWNPAGLHSVRNWELSLSNDIATLRSQSGMSIQSIGVARDLGGGHAAALSFSPDKQLEIVVPASLTLTEQSGTSVIARFDRQITYRQPFSLGYSFSVDGKYSVGAAVRLYETTIGDTKYSLDTNNIVTSAVVEYTSRTWSASIGFLLDPGNGWLVGGQWKNCVTASVSHIDDAVKRYDLDLSSPVTVGLGYEGIANVRFGGDVDSKKQFRAGMEWSPVTAAGIRGGVYCSSENAVILDALSFGAGFTWKTITMDLSYLRFRRSAVRSGSISVQDFEDVSFQDVDYTPFTSDRLSLSAQVTFGDASSPAIRIEYVQMLGEIFPAMAPLYAVQAVGKARIRNMSQAPATCRLGFLVSGLMDQPTETAPVSLLPGEERDLLLNAVFTAGIDSIRQLTVRDGTVVVKRDNGSNEADYQTRVVIRGRNDWNGDIAHLKYFVTSQSPEIVRFTRESLERYHAVIDSTSMPLQQFRKAKILFDRFSGQLFYTHDPRESQEYVQYPSETLSSHGGDCDDFSVMYASLLKSIGIQVAFVEVVPPAQKEEAHVYLLFDTGVPASDAVSVSSNPKKYILRKNEQGIMTAWVPVETTILKGGFDSAWATGAERFFNDTEIQKGLLEGWVRIEDVGNPY